MKRIFAYVCFGVLLFGACVILSRDGLPQQINLNKTNSITSEEAERLQFEQQVGDLLEELDNLNFEEKEDGYVPRKN